MKILILSCNTGQGHNSAGTAVYEELQRRGVDCEFKDALQFAGEKVSDSISKAYVFITTKAPPVFRFLYAAGGAISRPDKKSVIYYANKFYKDKIYDYIVQNGFDTVVTPHLFPAEVLTVLRKEKQLKVKTYAIATDYTCIPFWEETEMDFYFIPHKDLAEEFCEKGLPAEKLIATGIPVRKAFVSLGERQAAKRRLGFSEQEPLFLIMTGSMGYGNVEELTRQLLRRMGDRANIVIMGGNNQRMKEQLRERFSTYDRVHVLDYTRRVSEYMDACDLLMTKPGGLTSTEAAAKNVPLLLLNPIPGCETKNASFFVQKQMAAFQKQAEGQAAYAAWMLENKEFCRKMLKAQRENINPNAADAICDFILNR